MSFFDVITLFGGLAMFLYGMRLMGDGLKEGSSGTLKRAMERVTNNSFKAFLLGLSVTALIQSSTATIVITSGLVGAGILTLHQSLGILVGANVGTTVTGQIIRLMDLDSGSTTWLQVFQPSTLAPLTLIAGAVLLLFLHRKNSDTIGRILIGFGLLFAGLLEMTGAVDALSASGALESMLSGLDRSPLLGYLSGFAVAFLLQSSSASIGILQALSASGCLTFRGVYPVLLGIYLGDCITTALVCSIGAKPDPRRVGWVNVIFNLGKMLLVFAGVSLLHSTGAMDALWNSTVHSGAIANTNTVFNLASALILLPGMKFFEKISLRLIPDEPAPVSLYADKLLLLSPNFFSTPALALDSCFQVLSTMLDIARRNIENSLGLLAYYDNAVAEEVERQESELDSLTDKVSAYAVELTPHVHQKEQIRLLNQYYKLAGEFERLGDHATNICETAQQLAEQKTAFSQSAMDELDVLGELLSQTLDYAVQAFRSTDAEAAGHIEPMEETVDDVVDLLRDHHATRMRLGVCSPAADIGFSNLLSDLERISDICSNVGVATVACLHPEVSSRTHEYLAGLYSDETFRREYLAARNKYLSRLS